MSDDFASGYQPEDYGARIENGDYPLTILDVQMGYTQQGVPKILLDLGIDGVTFTVHYSLVKNEYFNKNATRFFDAFGIPRGNFNYGTWIRHRGMGRLERNEKGYMDLKYFIMPGTGSTPPKPPLQQSAPAQQHKPWPGPQPKPAAPAPAQAPGTRPWNAPQPAAVWAPSKPATPGQDSDLFADDIPF